MQRHREHHADLIAGARDVGHDARGRERDLALRDREPLVVGDHEKRVAHRLEVVERLAHAHHHDVGDEPAAVGRHDGAGRRRLSGPVAEPVAGDQDLTDDLAGGEIAHQPLGAGVAEAAIERAADLARDAQRAAPGLRDIDALDLVRPVAGFTGQPQQPFARAVDRDLLRHHLRPIEGEGALEFGAQLLGDARHHVEVTSRRAHRANARAAGRASCAGPAAPRSRRAPRRARRATCRRATAGPAARIARAGPSR